jgi:hypothetical protein
MWLEKINWPWLLLPKSSQPLHVSLSLSNETPNFFGVFQRRRPLRVSDSQRESDTRIRTSPNFCKWFFNESPTRAIIKILFLPSARRREACGSFWPEATSQSDCSMNCGRRNSVFQIKQIKRAAPAA